MPDLVPADKFSRLPERYQRRAREIADRVRDIDALCRPAKPSEVGDVLKRLRKQFRAQPDTDPREMAEGYRSSCRDLPAWAISEAASDYIDGKVSNHTGQFMPICAEFAKRVREVVMLPFLSERASLRTEASKLVERAEDEARRIAIDIERQDPRVKARAAAMIEQFLAGHPKPLPMKLKGIPPESQKRIDAMKKPRPFVSKIADTKIGKAVE